MQSLEYDLNQENSNSANENSASDNTGLPTNSSANSGFKLGDEFDGGKLLMNDLAKKKSKKGVSSSEDEDDEEDEEEDMFAMDEDL